MRPYRDGIELVPNALDLGSYAYRQRGPAAPRLVWLRAFHEVYNPALAPAVLAHLAADHPRAELLMVGADKGDGSLARARAAAQALGVADRVTFMGAVPKARVPEVLASGDIFLNTTDADNTPVSVIEAQASGLCVVSTNVGGLSHLLTHGRDALLVPPRDPAAMAAAVRDVIASPSLAAALSAGARESVERFDWQRVLPRWEALLAEIASSRAAADRS
jgi:glycosyltransferase involved in cell wall biosynthesis